MTTEGRVTADIEALVERLRATAALGTLATDHPSPLLREAADYIRDLEEVVKAAGASDHSWRCEWLKAPAGTGECSCGQAALRDALSKLERQRRTRIGE